MTYCKMFKIIIIFFWILLVVFKSPRLYGRFNVAVYFHFYVIQRRRRWKKNSYNFFCWVVSNLIEFSFLFTSFLARLLLLLTKILAQYLCWYSHCACSCRREKKYSPIHFNCMFVYPLFRIYGETRAFRHSRLVYEKIQIEKSSHKEVKKLFFFCKSEPNFVTIVNKIVDENSFLKRWNT